MEQVSTSTQACQRCWRRKERCDRRIPSCSRCTRAGMSCVQRVWGRVLSHEVEPDRVATQSYVGMLKHKIALLETKLAQTQVASPMHDSNLNALQRDRQFSDNRSQLVEDNPEGHDEQSIDTAADEVEYLSRFAMSGIGKRDDSTTGKPSPAELVPIVLSISGENPGQSAMSRSVLAQHELLHTTISAISVLDIPSAVKSCRRMLGPEYPMMEYKSCLDIWEAAKQAQDAAAVHELLQHSPEKLAMIGAVAALGIAVGGSGPSHTSNLPALVEFVTITNQKLSRTASDYQIIDLLILQAILSLYFSEASSTWHLIGLATTKAISLGIHLGLNADDNIDKDNEDNDNDNGRKGRENIFWVIYYLDRSLAFSMDRPFALEDFDMTLGLPIIPDQAEPSLIPSKNTMVIHYWMVHFMQMLSQWRRDITLDFETCFASYQYWQSVFEELSRASEHDDDASQGSVEPSRSYINKLGSQLSCKAQVQLLNKAFLTSLNPSLETFRLDVLQQVPQYIKHLNICVERHSMMLTFLDAYDLFAGILVFLYILSRPPILENYDAPLNNIYRPSIADMRTLMACIELLQTVAKQFTPVGELPEVLWRLLAALEEPNRHHQDQTSNNYSYSTQSSIQQLYDQIDHCSLLFPAHWRRIIDACLDIK